MALVSFVKMKQDLPLITVRKLTFIISALLLFTSITLYATKGLNLGVDFKGGINTVVRLQEGSNIPSLRSKLGTLGIGEIGIQSFGSAKDYLITVPNQEDIDSGANQEAVAAVHRAIGSSLIEVLSTEVVGPSVSAELFKAGLYATLFSLLAIAVYIAFRFEWRFAAAALAALIHDVITTIGFFALMGFEFNLGTIAAILTIAGYSINDTVVVFDRVREELRRYHKKPVPEILNLALNRTLSRTIVTSITTLLALLALTLFGGPVIFGFSVALIWGVLIGTYSSIFVATPLLLLFNLRPESLMKTPSDKDGESSLKKKLRAAEESQ